MNTTHQPGSTGNSTDQTMGESEIASATQTNKVRHNHSLWTSFAKRGFDLSIALVFFAVFGWLYVFLYILILIFSGSPVIFSQNRVGHNGRLFKFYKFRTMVPDAKYVLDEYLRVNPQALQQWTEFQKLEQDPRVTKLGLFLRKTSLDELPQFWNVLIGDMSVVGPRPCMPSQKDLYGKYWGHYCFVRPGITGLWQVSGRNQLNYNRRIALDVEYVENLSMSFDMAIIARTFFVVFTGHGSR